MPKSKRNKIGACRGATLCRRPVTERCIAFRRVNGDYMNAYCRQKCSRCSPLALRERSLSSTPPAGAGFCLQALDSHAATRTTRWFRCTSCASVVACLAAWFAAICTTAVRRPCRLQSLVHLSCRCCAWQQQVFAELNHLHCARSRLAIACSYGPEAIGKSMHDNSTSNPIAALLLGRDATYNTTIFPSQLR